MQLLRASLLVVGVLWVVGCQDPSLSFQSVSEQNAINAVALANGDNSNSAVAFQQTVYPLLRQNCAGCHATSQSPLFASPNAATAYNEVTSTGKVNFDSPSTSRLVQRLSGDLHNCWGNCDTNATLMLSKIQDWINQGGGAGVSTRVFSAEVLVPADLTTTAQNLSFPVDNLFNPPVPGARVVVSIVDTAGGAYRLSNPRIMKDATGGAVQIALQSIRVLNNGLFDPTTTTWDLVSKILNINTTAANNQITTTSLLIIKSGGPGFDRLKMSFAILDYANSPGLAASRFAAVKQLVQGRCTSCHNSGNPRGGVELDGLLTEADFLNARIQGRNWVVPGPCAAGGCSNSYFWDVVAGAEGNMPTNANDRAVLGAQIRTWIEGIQ
jgi:mono/diheme cytochrome c family protein